MDEEGKKGGKEKDVPLAFGVTGEESWMDVSLSPPGAGVEAFLSAWATLGWE